VRGWRRKAPGHGTHACCFFEDHVVIAERARPREGGGGAVTVERDAGKKVAAAFKGVKAAIHRNHGLLTASRHSIESAAFWFIALERCYRQQLMIEATGRPPVLVLPERARYSREHVGSDYIGWLHFQPIYDRLVQTNPDMFE
jgi:ribulose-5-phosphate 4-epimerase/fuculose-1-phosphate aldolase